ncbi:hypothetical protein BDQ17DRAFT_1255685 [Cyathus striatus]|nr:hypothetical protein BDQ17DRAFT_1255685 [Cyathus striatus]
MSSHTLNKTKKKAVIAAAVAVLEYYNQIPTPIPIHTSIFTGQHWLDELLTSEHPDCIFHQLGLSQEAFSRLSAELQLYHGLQSSKHVSADKQIAIFLYFACTGASSWSLQE